MSRLEPRQTLRLVVAGIFLTLLLAAVFTFGSLGVPFEPKNWRDAVTLYAVSTLITAALLVFSLILTRTMLRLWAERSKDHLGARFKTKMVVGAMAISLLPVVFMFFVSYSLAQPYARPLVPAPTRNCLRTNATPHQRFRPFPIPRLRNLARQAIPYVSAIDRRISATRFRFRPRCRSGFSTTTAKSFAAASSATIPRKIAPFPSARSPTFSAPRYACCKAVSNFGKPPARTISSRGFP